MYISPPPPHTHRANIGKSIFYLSDENPFIANHTEKIIYKNLWNGIDLHFYLNNGSLKYDFIVNLGKSYREISFNIIGADSIKIINNKLKIYTPIGTLDNEPPVSYQITNGSNIEIPAQYVLSDNKLMFDVKCFDTTKQLIIDPSQSWSTYYGFNNNDLSESVITEGTNVYFSGNTNSSNLPTTAGSFQPAVAGGKDAFIAKFDDSGNHLWTTYFGGTSDDEAEDINVIGTDIYFTGTTQSANFPVSTGAYQISLAGGRDLFIAKLNNSGSRIWSTYYGGGNDDKGKSIDTYSNKIVITGSTQSANFPVSAGAFQTVFAGGEDIFILRMDSSGTRDWATYCGGSGTDQGEAIAVDNDGEIYFTGQTQSANFPVTAGAFQTSLAGGWDVAIGKFDASGGQLWASYYGGSSDEFGRGVDNNSGDSIFFCGQTASANFPITGSAFQTSSAGGRDGYIAATNEGGSQLWSTYYGGGNDDFNTDISVSECDSIFIAGRTQSSNFPVTADAFQSSLQGGFDATLIGMDLSGNRYYSSYYGASNNDEQARGITTQSANIYFTGYTRSTNFPATAGAYQTTLASSDDAFLVKFTCTVCAGGGSPLPIELLYFEAICQNESITLKWTTASEINNDFFTIERSNDLIYWHVAGIVNGAGNSSQILNYLFIDHASLDEISYYRLKQTDFDGNFKYSLIIAVKQCSEKELNIFPNPFSIQTTLQSENPFNNAILTVTNCLGQIVVKLENLNGQTISFKRDNLPSGLYFFRLTEYNKIISIGKLVITD